MIYVEIEMGVNGSSEIEANVTLYVFELEAILLSDNSESEECIGAYVLCFVKSTNIKSALNKAKEYVSNERLTSFQIDSLKFFYNDRSIMPF